ncbi:MAG: hypothetical protein AMXMBFR52_10340 [Burkholderiales bacterium]
MKQGCLTHLTAVEFAGLGPVPFAGMLLADHGARVIRIDRPARITEATRRMFDDPAVVQKFGATGMEPPYASPGELGSFVERATAFWREQVRKSNFQAQ